VLILLVAVQILRLALHVWQSYICRTWTVGMGTPGSTRVDTQPLDVGDWVERRYGYGDARWGRITGRALAGHDCWVVASINGSVYRDNGRDLAISTQPAHVDSGFAAEEGPEPHSLPEWVGHLRDS
jgi:hypothetical protein